MNTYEIEIPILDCRGLSCPEPLTLLRNKVRRLPAGAKIILLSDDPVSLRDVPAYCNFMGHKLISIPDEKNPCRFIVEKKSQS